MREELRKALVSPSADTDAAVERVMRTFFRPRVGAEPRAAQVIHFPKSFRSFA